MSEANAEKVKNIGGDLRRIVVTEIIRLSVLIY